METKQNAPQAPKKIEKTKPAAGAENFEKTKPAAGADKFLEKNKARRRRRKILKKQSPPQAPTNFEKTKPAAGAGKFKKTGLMLAQILYYLKSASGVLTAAGVFFWKNTPGLKKKPAPGFCSRIRAGNSIFPPVTSNLFDP